MNTKRNSTLELFRVLLMLMVIALHYLYTGGVLDTLRFGEHNFVLAWAIEALCLVAVNCYVMLSAWFLSQKGAGFKKVLAIFAQVLFYAVGIYLVLCATGVQRFHLMTLVTQYLFPLSSGYNWFATVWVVYALLTPYLNRVSEGLEQKALGRLVLILFVAFSLLPTVLFFTVDNLGVKGGYSLLWFIFLHYLTTYLRKYGIPLGRWQSAAVYFGCSALSLLAKIVQIGAFQYEYWEFYHYHSITTTIGSVALFWFFIKLPERHHRVWCLLGSTTFGVLLIHTQNIIRTDILWTQIVRPLDYCARQPWIFAAHLVGCTLLIFAICSGIDLARQGIFLLCRRITRKDATRQ